MDDACISKIEIKPDDAAARSASARMLASGRRGKPRRRPDERLSVAMPIDARTKAGRAVRDLKARLLAHIGRSPTQGQLILIEQLLQLKLRLTMMDVNFLASSGSLSRHDTNTYLAWSNSFVRGLARLGLDGCDAETVPSLSDYLATKNAPRTAPQAPTAGLRAPGGSSAAKPAAPPARAYAVEDDAE